MAIEKVFAAKSRAEGREREGRRRAELSLSDNRSGPSDEKKTRDDDGKYNIVYTPFVLYTRLHTVIVVLLNTLYLIAARVPRHGSHVRPPAAAAATRFPFYFFRTRAKTLPSVSLSRENHTRPSPLPAAAAGPVENAVTGRRGPHVPIVAAAAAVVTHVSVGPPESVQHDGRVTDDRRRVQQIRQGEWTSIEIIIL